tara:strand:- start:462 stop:785 length:324 start_codon:yes stop_codon:yes gene_type:complete
MVRAFTLVETLVALVVLAILVSIISPFINTNIQNYNSQKLMTNLSEELKSHQYEMILNPKIIIKEFELNSCDMQKVSIAAGGDVKEKSIICLFGEFKVDRFAQIHPK